jgi:hypothetical protein
MGEATGEAWGELKLTLPQKDPFDPQIRQIIDAKMCASPPHFLKNHSTKKSVPFVDSLYDSKTRID